MPKIGNNLSSQVIEIQNEIFLVDCGEGTQVGLRKNKINFSVLNIYLYPIYTEITILVW